MSLLEIRTCSDSLLKPGQCCVCHERATMACLDREFVEHARCLKHSVGNFLGTQPLIWDPIWGAS